MGFLIYLITFITQKSPILTTVLYDKDLKKFSEKYLMQYVKVTVTYSIIYVITRGLPVNLILNNSVGVTALHQSVGRLNDFASHRTIFYDFLNFYLRTLIVHRKSLRPNCKQIHFEIVLNFIKIEEVFFYSLIFF